ncbi:NPCBM/NEW2 domain-containing protein [Kribbella sp. NBC_01484]|uniref:NPCBM/NEW2 domain-containing protein n=1 Tax=Kribbella sp. NBC_01484 TaxID=2903579 RepID=UPI003FA584DB
MFIAVSVVAGVVAPGIITRSNRTSRWSRTSRSPSGRRTSNASAPQPVDVTGAQYLTLATRDSNAHDHDHADWAEPGWSAPSRSRRLRPCGRGRRRRRRSWCPAPAGSAG